MVSLLIKALVYVEGILLDTDDFWGLGESSLILIEDELDELLKEDEQS